VLFPTLEFAIFFAVVLPVCWALSEHLRLWKLFLLLASYFFYGWWDWHFVGLLVSLTLINHALAHLLHLARGTQRRALLIGALTVNLGTLAFFKYFGFLSLSLDAALATLDSPLRPPLAEILLPVGISFFTFQAISYIVDVHRRRIAPTTLLDFAVYLALFPQLIAGPIVRAAELLPQLRWCRDPAHIPVGRAFRLVAAGLFKKVVLAERIGAALVDPVFADPATHSAAALLLAVYGYAAQIYCDFSAYSDIAIGLALLMGLRFPDNFNAPYTATSLQDFWRRWHMTLSRWLRDYLYIPLGGSRHGTLKTYRNLMLTMLLGGLWHGAAWRFVLWGGLHGACLAVERALRIKPPTTTTHTLLRRLWIFHFVCFCWIFFRAPSMARATEVLTGLVSTGGALPAYEPAAWAALAVGLGAQYIPAARWKGLEDHFARLHPILQGTIAAATLASINALSPPGVAAFIYFQF
jgi:alginate O-acetyltransferase complex protein AlgI